VERHVESFAVVRGTSLALQRGMVDAVVVNAEELVRDLFVFGGSAGGIEALLGILRRLPPDLPATIGVALHRSPLHRSPAFASQLAAVLGRIVPLPVSEPKDGEQLEVAHVYLAPRDVHMTIEDERWRLTRDPKVHRMRPAVDPLFASAAGARGPRVAGILLSGGGADGVEGLIAITGKGGLSIVQRPDEAQQPSMPLIAIREDDVEAALRTEEIAEMLPLLAAGRPYTHPRR
jgi:two-component system, chemotaxis family, protein-glutamate methylesterase/glutaminase